MNRSFSYIVTTFNAIHTRVGKIKIPSEKFPEMEISSSFLHVRGRDSVIKQRSKNEDKGGKGFAERRTLNAECRTANDSEVLWVGLGNRVFEVSGQFFRYNDSKWNLIYSVS